MDELGLFPLPLVLLPTERVPLHIFEERYKELIGDCLATGGTFGLLLVGASVGTHARVADVLERLPDGRLNIVVEGGARFRVLRETEGRSYLTALVETVEDEDDPPDTGDADRAVAAFRRLAELSGSDLEQPGAGPQLAFAIAARVAFTNETKQELLELRSPRVRLLRLTGLLERAAEAVALERELHDRAGGNGRVPPLRRDD